MTGSRGNSNTPIKDKNGKALLTKEEQDARWIEYFKETRNQPNPPTTFDLSTFTTINEIQANLGTISETETRKAIKMLKNNKTAGLDEISAELVKHGGTKMVQEITKLLNICWQTTNVPDEWRKGMIVKIPKKGNIAECNNWRGITLLSIPGKIFCIVLLNRIKDAANKALREEQGGFRNGRSCNEQIFTIRNIIEQSIEFQRPLLINFIDFKKAFDSIHRESLWKTARTYGIPEPFINIFRNIYLNSSCCVKTDIGNTEFFDIVTGVRQGCTLSPFLFLLAIDFVMREAMNDPDLGIKWNNKSCLTDLDFADDIALLANTKESLQKMTTKLEVAASHVGLRINSEKTKVMQLGNANTSTEITVGCQPIEEVKQFTYLGSVLSNDGNTEAHVNCRIGKASAVFQRLRQVWSATTINIKTKIRLYNTIVLPAAIYASETWKITTRIARKLNVFHESCLRRILGITYLDHITNDEILRRCNSRKLQDIVTERRMRFAGHVLRLPEQRHSKTAIKWTPLQGKRKKGRPVKTWRATFKEDLQNIGTKWEEVESVASNRERWRTLVAQCAKSHKRN